MGFGSFFKKIFKVAKVVAPIALAYVTGGTSAALKSAAGSLATGALGGAIGGSSQPKSSPVTGVTAPRAIASTTSSVSTADQVAENEKKKRLALNAAGASGNTTTPLGVTTGANVTKRNLLGL